MRHMILVEKSTQRSGRIIIRSNDREDIIRQYGELLEKIASGNVDYLHNDNLLTEDLRYVTSVELRDTDKDYGEDQLRVKCF